MFSKPVCVLSAVTTLIGIWAAVHQVAPPIEKLAAVEVRTAQSSTHYKTSQDIGLAKVQIIAHQPRPTRLFEIRAGITGRGGSSTARAFGLGGTKVVGDVDVKTRS